MSDTHTEYVPRETRARVIAVELIKMRIAYSFAASSIPGERDYEFTVNAKDAEALRNIIERIG